MPHLSRIEQITRSLAYMLRHRPEEFDLELDRYGAADVGEVVQALNERLGEPIEEEDLHEAIESGDRVRYDIKRGRIRALYGHSIEVDPGEPCKPPELLYVGLGSHDAERAERYGLRAGRRRFLHLAKTYEEAIETGRHQARSYAVVTIYALDAWEQGINFYDRISLFLSEPIPTEFLEVGEIHDDGEPPAERRGRERSGGRGRSEDRRRSGEGRRRGGRRSERSGYADEEERPEHGERSDRAPREDRPRREERGRGDSRRGERGDRGARGERGERGERRERGEHGEHGGRGGRRGASRGEGRPGRAGEGGRTGAGSSARPDTRRRPARPAEPAVEDSSPRKERGGVAFGAGLFAGSEPAPAAAPDPEPQKRAEPAPVTPEKPAKEEPSGPSFGAGL